MIKSKLFLSIIIFVFLIIPVFAALPCPDEDGKERAKLVVIGKVVGINNSKAKIEIESVRFGKNYQSNDNEKTELEDLNKVGYLEVQFIGSITSRTEGHSDASYVVGEKIKSYLEPDKFSAALKGLTSEPFKYKTQVGYCGKITLEKPSIFQRIKNWFKSIFK